jgi:GT2 family glycosyltransferase
MCLKMLDIITVNWNSGLQLVDMISSIKDFHSGMVSSVIIVDNASSDDSISLPDECVNDLPFELHVIHNKENLGFAAACNQGALFAESEYLLFLNPDTRLFNGSLSEPLKYMQDPKNERIGICGVQLVNESAEECLSYESFPSLSRFIMQSIGLTKFKGNNDKPKVKTTSIGSVYFNVDQVIGAFFIVRSSVFEQLHGFDERFFVYFEEVDFSLRAYKKGWFSVCLQGVNCMHAGGGISRQVKAERLFYSLRSRILFGFKHFSIPKAFALLLVTLVPEFISRSMYSLIRGSRLELKYTMHGYSMLINDIPAIFKTGFTIMRDHKQGDDELNY